MANYSLKELLYNDGTDLRADRWYHLNQPPANIPGGANYTTEKLDVLYSDLGALQIYWTGLDAADATLDIEGSITGIHWCSLCPEPQAVSLADCNALFDITSWGYRFIRFVYSAGSNTTGVINARALLKSRK